MKILVVVGTRPEVIKLVPVIKELRARQQDVTVFVTGQHDGIVEMLKSFGVEAGFHAKFQQRSGIKDLFCETAATCDFVISAAHPDLVIVQGDTTSALAGALAAFYRGIPVAHVEAGLRTWDLAQPYPEEANRIMIDDISTYLFCPTKRAKKNLRKPRHMRAKRIEVTGNTGIDTLLQTVDRDAPMQKPQPILVTAHRRENWEHMTDICQGIKRAAEALPDKRFKFITHMNPDVAETVRGVLIGAPNVEILPPQDYRQMVKLLQFAELVVTDSGGLQEEAAALGVPCLVLRETTERPEGLKAGAAILIGTQAEDIAQYIRHTHGDHWSWTWDRDMYGDGHAAERIADVLLEGE